MNTDENQDAVPEIDVMTQRPFILKMVRACPEWRLPALQSGHSTGILLCGGRGVRLRRFGYE